MEYEYGCLYLPESNTELKIAEIHTGYDGAAVSALGENGETYPIGFMTRPVYFCGVAKAQTEISQMSIAACRALVIDLYGTNHADEWLTYEFDENNIEHWRELAKLQSLSDFEDRTVFDTYETRQRKLKKVFARAFNY